MAGELIGAAVGKPGIGGYLDNQRTLGDYPGLYATMILILIIGIVVMRSSASLERSMRKRRGLLRPRCLTIDQLLAEARDALPRRPTVDELEALLSGDALVVDIRPIGDRTAEGPLPGAVVVDRNVLEWRLDPASPHRIPEVTGHDQRIVVVCNEGYASSLAAATLQRLGLRRATDLDGGYRAWAAHRP